VEEYDQNETFKRNLYLQSDGKLIGQLKEIGPLTGSKIEKLPEDKPLTNSYWYKVKFAQSFDPNGTYEYFAFGSSETPAVVSENDEITKLAVKITGTGNYYIDLSHEIKSDKIYQVMKLNSSWDDSRTSAHYKGSYGLTANISINTYLVNPNNYDTDFTKDIGIYQYRGQVKAANVVLLEGRSIIELSLNTVLSNYVFVEYETADLGNKQKVTNFTVLTVELKQTPSDADFDISGTGSFTYDGVPKAVTITPKDDSKSQGDITVHYTGTNGTLYDDTIAPADVGTYTVTFDVDEARGWEEAIGLPAGTLTINKADPVVTDFDISGTGEVTYDGSVKTVDVTLAQGKTGIGTITVKYNGSTTEPADAGIYTVTFDVTAGLNFNAAPGLPAGTLTINKADPVVADFDISGNGIVHYNGSPKKVTVTIKQGKSGIGDITVKYNDSTTVPSDVGIYTVTFDVAEGTNYNLVNGLSAGTLTIINLFNVTLLWSDLPTKPTISSNNSSFTLTNTNNLIDLIIDIQTANISGYSTFDWYADFASGRLSNENGNSGNLKLSLNAYTTGLNWSVPGKFNITLVVDNKYSVVFEFTTLFP